MPIVETMRVVPTLEMIEVEGLPPEVAQSLWSRAGSPARDGKRIHPSHLPPSVRNITYHHEKQRLRILFTAAKVNRRKALRLTNRVLNSYGLQLDSFACRSRTIWKLEVELKMPITERLLFTLLSNQLLRLPGILHVSWYGDDQPIRLSGVALVVTRKPTSALEEIVRYILA